MVNEKTPTDELRHLLARIVLKDQQALSELYQKVAPKLNGVAMKMLHDADLSNDVLQETMLQIWNNASEYRSDLGEPMTWMTSLMRYRTLDKIKSESREQNRRNEFKESHMLLGDDELDFPLKVALEHEDGSRLSSCLDTLDALNRNAILMAYYYGYSRQEIAERLAQSINTVKSWLKRSLVRLASCLDH